MLKKFNSRPKADDASTSSAAAAVAAPAAAPAGFATAPTVAAAPAGATALDAAVTMTHDGRQRQKPDGTPAATPDR